MNNELSDNYYIGALNDDGSYTRISKITDIIVTSDDLKIDYSIVKKLPRKKEKNTIYYVATPDGYDCYIWLDKWHLLGRYVWKLVEKEEEI